MESTCRVEVLDRLGRVTVSEKPYHLRQHLRRAVVQPAVFRRDPQRMVELARGGSAQERQDLGRVMAHRGHDEIRCHRRQHAEHLRREVPGVVVGVDGPGDVERAAGYRSRRGRVRAGESARHAREGAQVRGRDGRLVLDALDEVAGPVGLFASDDAGDVCQSLVSGSVVGNGTGQRLRAAHIGDQRGSYDLR